MYADCVPDPGQEESYGPESWATHFPRTTHVEGSRFAWPRAENLSSGSGRIREGNSDQHGHASISSTLRGTDHGAKRRAGWLEFAWVMHGGN